MLVLSRKKGEKIRINDEIIIEILEINTNSIKLGFIAPQNVKIYRDELYQKIIEENIKAKSINVAELETILKELQK